jgi:hypothetical protein
VIVIEHDMRVAAVSDWIIDIGPGAGNEGGRVLEPERRGIFPSLQTAEPRPILSTTSAKTALSVATNEADNPIQVNGECFSPNLINHYTSS